LRAAFEELRLRALPGDADAGLRHAALRALTGDGPGLAAVHGRAGPVRTGGGERRGADRKSTRLNSSHRTISYAVFCLKKKNWRNPVWMRMRLLPVRRPEPATRRSSEIGRAHVCTPVTFRSRMPSSA